ncbi:hypothetical protein CY658_23225 [Variovorax sp. RO1]|uniref:hypothetical protein n=1 Tax=Variovorax sp. RO1 TaxID=2066034 RepID=UPI000C717153|nr:hypothetical protein [Variovorax sp. RO1]PLC02828.1 hypothetical protein CY658_23225 [Variovorax sp. RO1]
MKLKVPFRVSSISLIAASKVSISKSEIRCKTDIRQGASESRKRARCVVQVLDEQPFNMRKLKDRFWEERRTAMAQC